MKDFYKKLLVIGAVFVVVLELTSLGGFGIFNAPAQNSNVPIKNQSQILTPVSIIGTAYANATVTSFRPYLVVQALGNVTEGQINAIEGVDDIVRSQGAYAIGLNEPAKMGQVYLELKKLGLTSQAMTSMVIDTSGELISMDGKKTPIVIQGTTIELTLQKPVEVQTRLRIKIDGAQAIDGKLVGGQAVSLDFKPMDAQFSGNVVSQDTLNTYEYLWETRNLLNMAAIKEMYGASTQTLRKDYFIVNASALEISLAAQNKTYVINVQGNKVFVAKDFVDKDEVIRTFGESVQFETSTIRLTNQTIKDETATKTEYVISLLLNENQYGFEKAVAQSDTGKELGEEVRINATILANGPIGDSIVSAMIRE